jgi:hypothetical protein
MPSSVHTDPRPESTLAAPAAPRYPLLAPIVAAVVTWITAVYVALVLESPYWNDDLVDKNLRSMLKTSHTSLIPFIWSQISAFVKIDARFDPGLLAWTYTLFDVFDNRNSYKLVIGLLLALAVLAVGLCVVAMAKSWIPGAAFILIASGTLQVRLWADGITSFAGVMTLTTALTFGALLLLLTKPGLGWATLAAVLYTAALLTYEAVFLFAPVMIVIIVLLRRNWRPAIAIAAPAALALLMALSLRLFTNAHPIPEYTLSFGPHAVFVTFSKQMIAALPLSQWWLGHTFGLPPIAGTLILMAAVLVGIPVFVGLYHLSCAAQPKDSRTIGLWALLGVWIWLSPAALVSVTKRWQTDIPWGQGYIPVVYEYLGLALCLLSIWMLMGRWLRSSRSQITVRAWSIGGAAGLAILSTLTMAANFSLMP